MMTKAAVSVSTKDAVMIVGKTEVISDGAIKVDFDLNKFFGHYVDQQLGSLVENYSPVAQVVIGVEQCMGVKINGSFRTDFSPGDTVGYDGMCYITVRRNSTGKAMVHCGYGIAFRPSFPDADIAGVIDGTPALDTGTNTYDLPMAATLDVGFSATGGMAYYSDSRVDGVIFYYGATSGNNLIDCAFPENIIPVDTGTVNLAADNIFVVDNDLIGSDIYNHNIIEYDSGIMSYLTSCVHEIKPDTLYYYQLTIGSDNAMSLLISEDPDSMGTEVIGYGAYTPLAEYLETSDMNAFGIGIANTRGFTWEFGDIYIANIAGEYPGIFFKMDTTELPDEFVAQFRGRGYGYNSGTPTDGLNLYIYNRVTPGWELLSTNTYSDMSATNLITISEGIVNTSTYKDVNNIVDFHLVSIYPSGDAGDEEAFIIVDYFKLQAAINASLNIGGCADVYVDDPHIKPLTTAEFAPTSAYYAIPEFVDRSVVWIEGVYVIIATARYRLLEGVDYFWHVNDENYRGSTRVVHSIRFNTSISGNIEIDFRYSHVVVTAQNHVDDDYVSYCGQDVLVKHMGIHMLEIASDGTGVAELVEEYIKTLEQTDGKYFLRWDDVRKYILEDQTISTLVITDNYRVDGVLKQQEILGVNQYIEIGKTETFKIEELLDA